MGIMLFHVQYNYDEVHLFPQTQAKEEEETHTSSSLQWVAVDTMLCLLSCGVRVVGDEGGPGAEPPAGLAGDGIFPVVAGGQQVTQPPAGAP